MKVTLFFMCSQKTDLIKFLSSTILLCGLAYTLYVPGLAGSFIFDDFPNLKPLGYYGGVTDLESALRFVFGNNSGPTGRPVSMASFLLDDNSWPSNPYYFKHTNLLLHMAAGLVGLLVLNRLITHLNGEKHARGPHWFCLIVIGIWLLHPINVSTVLYPVQRMAILSAIFSMTSLYFYLLFREDFFDDKRTFYIGYFILSVFFIFLAFFSKENGILVLPFIVFLEIFCFRESVCQKAVVFFNKNYVNLIIACITIILLLSGWWARGYEGREFGLYDRLIYQVPILGNYILKIAFPYFSDFNLFSGDYDSIAGRDFCYIDYIRMAVAISFFVFLIIAIRRKNRLAIFGLLWFFTFHLVESTFYPLELYFEHRNYLPSIGLILFLASVIDESFKCFLKSGFLRSSITIAAMSYLSFILFLLSLTWAEPDELFLKWEMDEPGSARAKVIYASILEEKAFPENSIEHISRAIELRPKAIGLHLTRIRLVCQFGLEFNLAEAEKELANADQFDMGVLSPAERLIELDKDLNGLICEDAGHPISLQQVFFYIEGADARPWGATRTERYYSLKSDFFAEKGLLDPSIKALDKAIAATGTVDLYLKKAVMLASAGLASVALDVLVNAEAADEKRPQFYPSRLDEIRHLKQRIKVQNDKGPINGV